MSTSASIIIYQTHFRNSRGCTCRKVKVYSAETDNLKGWGREMINFLEDINKATLCVYLLMDFKFFWFLVVEQILKTKVFAWFYEIIYY